MRIFNFLKFSFVFILLITLLVIFKLNDWQSSVFSSINYGWSSAPDITLICRLYSGSVLEFYNMFLVSYMLFWPYRTWTNTRLVVVLDKESDKDHRLATILANLPPYPIIHFEEYKNNTYCSDWKREGYSRQQYSTFYSDIYTQTTYVGIVDSDAFFVTPEDLFVNNGRPRLYGYNGCCTNWHESINESICMYSAGEFMISSGFPVMIKREHFEACRNHITLRMKARSFEEAFKMICQKYPTKYSQIDLLAHYLWHFKRNEYSWHINSDESVLKGGHFTRHMTQREEVLEKNQPIVALMKHGSAAKGSTHFEYSSHIAFFCSI